MYISVVAKKTSSICQTEPMWSGDVLYSLCYRIYDSSGNTVKEPGLLFDFVKLDNNLHFNLHDVQIINDSYFYILYTKFCNKCENNDNLLYQRLYYANIALME